VSGVTALRFMELMSVDKKAAGGRIRFVLLEHLGSAVIRGNVPQDALDAVLAGVA
jgi:3-dehydroquinate synthase